MMTNGSRFVHDANDAACGNADMEHMPDLPNVGMGMVWFYGVLSGASNGLSSDKKNARGVCGR